MQVDWKKLEEKDYINNLCNAVIKDINVVHKQIIDVKKKRTWLNTIQPLIDLDNRHSINSVLITFPNMIYPNKQVRDSSDECRDKLTNLETEWFSDRDFYNAVKTYSDEKEEKLNLEQLAVLRKLLKSFEDHGVTLNEYDRKRLVDINKEITSLATEYEKNSRDYKREFLFTAEELSGLPDDILESKRKVVDVDVLYNALESNPSKRRKITECDSVPKYVLTLQYPDYFPIMDYVHNADVRKFMYSEFSSKCVDDNIPILEKIIKLRQEIARLFDQPTFAHYAIKDNMAKTPNNVLDFLKEARSNLSYVLHQEKIRYKQLNNNIEPKIYDMAYLINKYKEEETKIDMRSLKDWFPLDKVVSGTFQVYSQLFSLRFEKKVCPVWHEDVTYYEVYDKNTNEYMGGVYLDPFPRNGKYNHACCASLTKRFVDDKENVNYPIAAMICNFSPGSNLEYDEVVTYFHEFGHAVHHLCGKTSYAILQPHSVEIDFVECPSQMFEYWCTEKSVLELMTSYSGKDPQYEIKQTIPQELIDKIKKQKNLGEGYSNMRQISIALADLQLHMDEKIDIYNLYQDVCQKVLGMPLLKKSNMFGDFGHMVGEYCAGYYSYLWSKVYASDIYFSKFEGKCLDSKLGLEFRKKVFEPGCSKPAMDMLVDFLGRAPSTEAIMRELSSTLNIDPEFKELLLKPSF